MGFAGKSLLQLSHCPEIHTAFWQRLWSLRSWEGIDLSESSLLVPFSLTLSLLSHAFLDSGWLDTYSHASPRTGGPFGEGLELFTSIIYEPIALFTQDMNFFFFLWNQDLIKLCGTAIGQELGDTSPRKFKCKLTRHEWGSGFKLWHQVGAPQYQGKQSSRNVCVVLWFLSPWYRMKK